MTANPYINCGERRAAAGEISGARAAAAPMEQDPLPPSLNLSSPGTTSPPLRPRAAWAGSVLLLALVGNGLVLRRLCGGRPRRRRDLLVGHLALADLAGCGLALLPRLAAELRGSAGPPGAAACRLLPLLQRCGPLASAHGLVLLALERHRPTLPAGALAALGWLLAPLLALPHAFAFRPAPRPGGSRCRSVFEELPRWHGLAFAVYGAATGFLGPAGLLCWACARSLAARRQRMPGPGGGLSRGRARARVLRLPLVLAGLFALCRLPRCAAELGLASAPGVGRRDLLAALGIVAAANSALNPFACLLLHSRRPGPRRLRRDLPVTGTAAAAACSCCLGLDGQGRRGATLRRPLRRRAGTPGTLATRCTPGIPDIPGTPNIPGTRGSPGASGTPGTPGIPSPGAPAAAARTPSSAPRC
ncbi:probable G-protein coupled receptor 150 [Patagioenas fasciata]|uniref:probable G-protein coupled receptor 150 n=1 Tax=Patagioenas fasciata TaxID=372321 RepID=UPI003A9A6365